jgi:glucose-6-phosphate 1-epimerase
MPYQKTHDRVLLKHPKVGKTLDTLRCQSLIPLKYSQGATAEVLLFGATVTSWKATQKSAPGEPIERLFVSSKAILDGSKAVRGGIPVVFPCFGPPEHPDHSRLPQHGFARNEFWAFDSVVMDDETGVSVRLSEYGLLLVRQ